MHPSRRLAGALLALILAAVTLAGCSEHQEQTAARSVSPLIGTWTRDGNTPASSSNGPQFTKLTFHSDGKLDANYAASGVAPALGSAPSVKAENDTYTTSGDASLSVAEGSRHLDYTYRVSGGKLYLTASGQSDAAVFSKAG